MTMSSCWEKGKTTQTTTDVANASLDASGGPRVTASTAGPRRNLELKARYADHAAAEGALQNLGAKREWSLRQVDTYFVVPHGRLKLREQEGRDAAELIAYDRPNATAVRASDYQLVPVPDPAMLKSALARSLGIRVVVAKRRTLWMWHNVRIHLDQVESLGTFLEFEAVLASPDEPDGPSRERLDQLTRALHVRDDGRIAASYSDLLESRA
jgi:predicted adenylyl cyclase CyaB